MGYTTDFNGHFVVSKGLSSEQVAYLKKFAGTRRMKRNAELASRLPDPEREAIGLPIGEEGCYFVGGTGECGQDEDASVIDYNSAPKGQPSLWCHWEPSEDGERIEWNGAEKFYRYVEWLSYIVKYFLIPWNRVLNGEVQWEGEDSDDAGVIQVSNNVINTGSPHRR